MKTRYLLSIITVVYNGEKFIQETMNSIASKKRSDVEYIVVDGASTDQTLSIIEENGEVVDQCISEEDKGIFDAMNKGLRLACGKWVVFINAGDEFLLDLNLIDWGAVEKNAIIYGNTVRTGRISSKPFELKMIESGSLPMCHQSTLYNRELLGGKLVYSQKYKLYGENALLMNLYCDKYEMTYVDTNFSFFLGGGVSDTVSSETRKAKYFFLYHSFGLKGVLKGILYKFGLLKYEREQ